MSPILLDLNCRAPFTTWGGEGYPEYRTTPVCTPMKKDDEPISDILVIYI
jgi:hypothetical protein